MSEYTYEKLSPGIGRLKERSLHAALKEMLSRSGDRVEQQVGTHVIDIVRGKTLIEVQTGSFAKLRPKLQALLGAYRVHVVYPVAVEKWIVQVDAGGREIGRRRSPRKGKLVDVVRELSSIAAYAGDRNLTLKVLMARVEEVRHADGKGSWRRRGVSIVDRRLIEVIDTVTFSRKKDYLVFLPDTLPSLFTNGELAAEAGINRRQAQGITYCLRKMDLLEVDGKKGRELRFCRKT
jgi:hypothetical protein